MSWIAAGVSVGLNLGMAAYQSHKAKKLANTPRPEYQIPQGQVEALNNAKYMASQTELPGQNIMQQKIDQSSAGALANLKDVSQSGSALGSNIASIYRGNVGAQNQLNLAGAQNYNANQQNLRGELNNMATAQDKQWTINKFGPYKNNMAAASAMREGAFRNATAGVTDIASAGAGYANQQFWAKQLSSQAGGPGAGTIPPTPSTMNFPGGSYEGSYAGYQDINDIYSDPNSPYIGRNQATPPPNRVNMQPLQRAVQTYRNPNYDYTNE
jgi:hypothetical protein